jgi:hypothetical protein
LMAEAIEARKLGCNHGGQIPEGGEPGRVAN